jgi:hypothetical protein
MKTTVLALVLVPLVAGCPGDGSRCGPPHDADVPGVEATVEGMRFGYGRFIATHARDCGLESTTIDGEQVSPTAEPFHLTICVIRGDLIGGAALSFADATVVDLVDVNARDADGCTISLDFTATPSGSVSFLGYCNEGGNGFLMTVSGSVAGFRACPADAGTGTPESITIGLSGTADVAFPIQ